MLNKSKASSTAKNILKQQIQLKEWNAAKDLFKQQNNSNEQKNLGTLEVTQKSHGQKLQWTHEYTASMGNVDITCLWISRMKYNQAEM